MAATSVSEQIGQKLDLLIANPDQIDSLTEEIGQLLRACNAKRQLFDSVKHILEKGFSADRSAVPIFGKLFASLIGTTIICAESGKLCSFRDALCSCLAHPVALNLEAFESFRRKLPLMNELYKSRLVQWNTTKVLIGGLQQNDQISIRYLFELVRNIDHLVDEHIAAFPKANIDPYWCGCVARMKKALDDGIITEQAVLDEMTTFFQSLKHKHRWCSSLIASPSDKKRKSWKSESECIPAKKPMSSSPPSESHGASPIGLIMETLTKHSHYWPIATSKLRTMLENSSTLTAFSDGVLEILNMAFSAESRGFTTCIQLLESLRDLTVHGVTFPQAVFKCTAVKKSFQTAEEIDRFCAGFRLLNELVRIGLVPSDIFQHYAANLTNDDGEMAMILLFKIVVNVNKLIETSYAKLTADEAKFWTCQNRRLTGALQRDLIHSPAIVAEVSNFLGSHETKGGWNQTPIETKPEDVELSAMVSGIALVDNFKTWLWPLIAKFQSMATPADFCEAVCQLLVKMCELITDERTLIAAGEICQILIHTDFGRSKSFYAELEHFCVRFLTGKQAGDMEHVGLKTANPALERLLYLLMKRRQGCTRLIGHLYMAKVFEVPFLVSLCDALLATRSFSGLECLFWLFTDIGRVFSSVILEKNLATWWTTFFDELQKIVQSISMSDEVKRLAKAILVEKAQWPALDSKTRARASLSKLLSELTPELRRSSPSDFSFVLQKVRNLLAQEIPDSHSQQMFEILLNKLNSSYKDIDTCLPANPTPLPTSSD